jgi:hypothetical protein
MTDYAKLGTHTLLRRANSRMYPGGAGAVARPGHPVVGWTAPTVIYDKMLHIDSGAKEMNALMIANVTESVLRAAWAAWYTQWLAFFAKYQDTFARLGALLYTDDLARETEDYRRTFESFRATYAIQRTSTGAPLPQPSTAIPGVLNPGEKKKEDGSSAGIEIPWWIWTVGGIGLALGGYFLYKKALELRAKRRALDAALPTLLQGYGIPKEISQAAVATDPSRAPRQPASASLAPSEIFIDVQSVQVHEPGPSHEAPEPHELHREHRHERHEHHEHTQPSRHRHAASWRGEE